MTVGKIKITGGFVLLWTITFYLESGSLLWIVWLAAFCHEAGHLIAIKFCGGKISQFDLAFNGLTLHLSSIPQLSYAKEIICVLAGPTASFVGGLLFGLLSDKMSLVGMCVLQGLYNLLPSVGLDGGRAIRLFLQWKEIENADNIIKIITIITTCMIAVLGGFLAFFTKYDLTITFATIYLLLQMITKEDEGSYLNER